MSKIFYSHHVKVFLSVWVNAFFFAIFIFCLTRLSLDFEKISRVVPVPVEGQSSRNLLVTIDYKGSQNSEDDSRPQKYLFSQLRAQSDELSPEYMLGDTDLSESGIGGNREGQADLRSGLALLRIFPEVYRESSVSGVTVPKNQMFLAEGILKGSVSIDVVNSKADWRTDEHYKSLQRDEYAASAQSLSEVEARFLGQLYQRGKSPTLKRFSVTGSHKRKIFNNSSDKHRLREEVVAQFIKDAKTKIEGFLRRHQVRKVAFWSNKCIAYSRYPQQVVPGQYLFSTFKKTGYLVEQSTKHEVLLSNCQGLESGDSLYVESMLKKGTSEV